ncbi:MAG TPA: ABC transporter permease [Spirochaetota bacterium]|nr:ABC transporter permease [Spirochaetota bacterium]
MDAITFFAERKTEILTKLIEHINLVGISIFISICIGIPLGIILTRFKKLMAPVINIINIIQTIPSLALLGFLLPVFGIGLLPSIVALSLYSLLAIVKNTIAGIQQINPAIIEAGTGMGMTKNQILFKIELPLAMPIIFSGIRIAAVICIGIATLCSTVGAGGLGDFIFTGISMSSSKTILAGAVPAALLAIITDLILLLIEKKLTYRR